MLFLIEISIATWVKDDFIRPYVGDFLVVILLYCFLMAVTSISVIKGLIIVLIFSWAVEFFQLINIVQVLHFKPSKLVMIVLGSSFSVYDLLAYFLGILFIGLLEYYSNFAKTKIGK
tara:strand:- start:1347 stop:1697 length:351 start_codon:yes stop_codon:yes gene_type:complete